MGEQENHITDLQETFANFRQAGLKLNPEKCVFGVKKGKFLGCLVSTKGIEANPNKIEAILRMEPPSTKKGAQRLTGTSPHLRSLGITVKPSLTPVNPAFLENDLSSIAHVLADRKSTRLNSSHITRSRMPSSA